MLRRRENAILLAAAIYVRHPKPPTFTYESRHYTYTVSITSYQSSTGGDGCCNCFNLSSHSCSQIVQWIRRSLLPGMLRER